METILQMLEESAAGYLEVFTCTGDFEIISRQHQNWSLKLQIGFHLQQNHPPECFKVLTEDNIDGVHDFSCSVDEILILCMGFVLCILKAVRVMLQNVDFAAGL